MSQRSRLHIPGQPDQQPRGPRPVAYNVAAQDGIQRVTAVEHNRAMAEIERSLRSVDGALQQQAAGIGGTQQGLRMLMARHEALERVLCSGQPVTLEALQATEEAVRAEWMAAQAAAEAQVAEVHQECDDAPDPAPVSEAPAVDLAEGRAAPDDDPQHDPE